jgi:hypothetical protein
MYIKHLSRLDIVGYLNTIIFFHKFCIMKDNRMQYIWDTSPQKLFTTVTVRMASHLSYRYNNLQLFLYLRIV